METRRIAGDKLIVPDQNTKELIHRSDVKKIVGTFRLCIDETGHAESALPMKSTGFAKYDVTILNGMRQWVYTPYLVDGEAVPVCTPVTFIYSQR